MSTGISCIGEDGKAANMTECLQWAGPIPSQIRECWVPCKDDCTLTTWSKFSDCTGCGSSSTRRRSLIGKDFNIMQLLYSLLQEESNLPLKSNFFTLLLHDFIDMADTDLRNK